MLGCRWIDGAEDAGEEECAAAAHLALYPNAATHHFDQTGTDCETEAGAAVFAGGGTVGLTEGFEDDTAFVGGNADAGILH
jgi:hypothetical protein